MNKNMNLNTTGNSILQFPLHIKCVNFPEFDENPLNNKIKTKTHKKFKIHLNMHHLTQIDKATCTQTPQKNTKETKSNQRDKKTLQIFLHSQSKTASRSLKK